MKHIIDETSNTPAYLQLYRQVRDDVVRGVYPYGGKLPSKRTVAADLGVSTVTVEHAYALLAEEGYVEPRERSGYFVIFRAADGFAAPSGEAPHPSANAWAEGSDDADGASAAQHTYDGGLPFAALARTMRRVITDYGDALLDRSPNAGCVELREAIRGYLARNRGIRAGVEQIVIGSGAEYLYGLIVELIGRDRVYAIEQPSYRKIEQVYRASDVRCELLPLERDGISSAALAASTADVLHTTPYRSYPSGVTATASKRHEYVRWAGRGERIIVEDDFESEFSVSTKPEETLFSLAEDCVIYMNTFSRTVSPSLRVGYMVLPKRLVEPFEQKLGFYSCTVPTYVQFVLAELIRGGDFERHINRVRRSKRKELRRDE